MQGQLVICYLDDVTPNEARSLFGCREAVSATASAVTGPSVVHYQDLLAIWAEQA